MRGEVKAVTGGTKGSFVMLAVGIVNAFSGVFGFFGSFEWHTNLYSSRLDSLRTVARKRY